MSDNPEINAVKEQVERRRLNRMIEALPVFAGFASPDGHLLQAHPPSPETYIWALPHFSYSHDSVTSVIDLCERASRGERIQIERKYLKEATEDGSSQFGRGLLTIEPVEDDMMVDTLAITLLDCDEHDLRPPTTPARSRLSVANARISAILSLSQTVIEALSDASLEDNRDRISQRLDILSTVIDPMSDPDARSVPLKDMIRSVLERFKGEIEPKRLSLRIDDIDIGIDQAPIVILLIGELSLNALHHGALSRKHPKRRGTVTLEADILDSIIGRTLRLHWIEDGGPRVPAVIRRGFGVALGETLFPQITGGTASLLNDEDGIGWSFEMPLPAESYDTAFDSGGGL